jgi:hypothetical protein
MTLDERRALVATALSTLIAHNHRGGRLGACLVLRQRHAMASCGADVEKMDATIVARVDT